MLEQVDSYTYLATVISQDGRIDQEVANRVQKANSAYFQMNIIFGKRELEMKIKTRICCMEVKAGQHKRSMLVG
jgi:hypothetical protein